VTTTFKSEYTLCVTDTEFSWEGTITYVVMATCVSWCTRWFRSMVWQQQQYWRSSL